MGEARRIVTETAYDMKGALGYLHSTLTGNAKLQCQDNRIRNQKAEFPPKASQSLGCRGSWCGRVDSKP